MLMHRENRRFHSKKWHSVAQLKAVAVVSWAKPVGPRHRLCCCVPPSTSCMEKDYREERGAW